jgi:hypothetical protein
MRTPHGAGEQGLGFPYDPVRSGSPLSHQRIDANDCSGVDYVGHEGGATADETFEASAATHTSAIHRSAA